MALSWKPRSIGNLYCSPACGMGCTHKQNRRAHKLADALVKKCQKEIGGVWIKTVHENLGWHYSVHLKGGDFSVSQSIYGKYYIGFSGGTPSHVHVGTHSKSIKWLVRKQLSMIKEESEIWSRCLTTNKAALSKSISKNSR